MKIGIFDPYLDDLGGGEKYMMKIAECLSRQHEVIVFWDEKEDTGKLLEWFSLDLSRVSLRKNIFSPKVNLFTRVLATRNFDIIIFLSDGSIPLSLSKKLFIHLQQPIPNLKVNVKTKFKIKRVNKFFCNSYYSKSYIDKQWGIDSAVLYPPVGIKAKPAKKENIILHVGRFRAKDPALGIGDYKKQYVMIDAFKEMIHAGLKNWRFMLAVSVRDKDQNLFKKMKDEAAGYPIEFLVNKTNDELWKIYSKVKIYWHASGFGENLVEHPEYAEHFGISTVEAMGAGVVPVVINAGGQPEIVEDGKNGFLWMTLDELQKRTLQLVNNGKLREEMAKEAVMRAKVFNEDRFCKELKAMVEE